MRRYGNPADNCYIYASDQWTNQGCGINGAPDSVNGGFNNHNGGVYALEWVAETEIRSFYFPRASIPADIISKQPNPSSWGNPYSRFEVGEGSDCSSNHFNAHQIIFDLTFCGDWAGATFSDQCKTSESCESYVKYNPSYFKEAYWSINYVNIYDIKISS